MSKPDDEVVTFLQNTTGVEGRELDVAIVYAGMMARELRSCAAEWEATVVRLRGLKGEPYHDFNRTDSN